MGDKPDKVKAIEDQIIKKYERITGVVPIGIRDMLHIFASQDMMDLMIQYFYEMDRRK